MSEFRGVVSERVRFASMRETHAERMRVVSSGISMVPQQLL